MSAAGSPPERDSRAARGLAWNTRPNYAPRHTSQEDRSPISGSGSACKCLGGSCTLFLLQLRPSNQATPDKRATKLREILGTLRVDRESSKRVRRIVLFVNFDRAHQPLLRRRRLRSKALRAGPRSILLAHEVVDASFAPCSRWSLSGGLRRSPPRIRIEVKRRRHRPAGLASSS